MTIGNSCWEKERHFLLKAWSLVGRSHSRGWAHTQEYLEHKLDSMDFLKRGQEVEWAGRK